MTRGAVILAAGQGTRMGGVAKALLRTPLGPTFLEMIAMTARSVGLETGIVVVAAPFGAEVAAHARSLDLECVVNPAPLRGMASSVALGFAAMETSMCDAAWLWPVDHPFVAPATLAALIAALGDHAAARPVTASPADEAAGARREPRSGEGRGPRGEGRAREHHRHGGHPPLVARGLWSGLAACGSRTHGARDVFATADVIDVAVTDRACFRDVDTTADLHEAAR